MALIKNSRATLSILIVEDDNVASETMSLILSIKFTDVAIYIAGNGKLGVDLFKEYMPDIVITDINMPEMNGLQMASEIRSVKDDTHFIVLTGNSDQKYLEEFSEIGFNNYLVKPIELEIFFAAIEKCVIEVTQVVPLNAGTRRIHCIKRSLHSRLRQNMHKPVSLTIATVGSAFAD